jgi:hypothetical protein
MKIKQAIQHSTSLKLLLSMLMAICMFSAAANAQPRFVGKFTLPYEVRWGQAVLPAGNYFIRIESTAAPATISSQGGGRTVFMKPPILADSERGGTYLTVTSQGNQRRIRSLNLPEIEREAVAIAGQLDKLSVVTAKK